MVVETLSLDTINANSLHSLQQTLQIMQRLRVGTERVRSWYGAGLVLIEILINEIHRFILLLVNYLGINLGGGYSGMS